ncbi:MAG: HAD family hydrolase [Polaromonas sp. 39-63-203]|jgi:HAD superfamily hydrolase (TIGR01484 family)|uniref:HAD-IIB family hydrolase n=1 Tax=Polaromonas sp. TaxID=1869339 RepID=UPI000BCA3975|nr:HAD-IIB family hydrolase [Polaromonas sp.]OYY53815.1 MAG: HAD family hydrolase [Polaromonas sp. 35-63-240]OYZ02052.1 MAG: HAD family hydrolase [Polaromonas sp. 28-63-22]OYZ84233.1 MAG: HAD family hydrolase [Polaromonas sp. 24-62-144]OZB01197.1 MAG: HAD family hydrolase [Polaromonas sp. 39-63-203]HQS30806.1 HAD-IIB family hydrolase [Polaromonas sp.]
MLNLNAWPLAARQRITGVLTDIDDTLTTDGAITADALAALADLKAAGLPVMAITGRPVGWSEPFARDWPVDAIVAENGAVALTFQHQIGLQTNEYVRGQLSKRYQQSAPVRRENFSRMQQLAARVLREVPGTQLARDSAGRETDMAIDHSEFAHLSDAQIAAVVALMTGEGMQATVSSIHINGWYGSHNKLEGARWAVRELLQRDLDLEMAHWVFIGDSTNDALMFQAFEHSVGVANVRRFETQLTQLPRYITQGERGAGFAEVARAVLDARMVDAS